MNIDSHALILPYHEAETLTRTTTRQERIGQWQENGSDISSGRSRPAGGMRLVLPKLAEDGTYVCPPWRLTRPPERVYVGREDRRHDHSACTGRCGDYAKSPDHDDVRLLRRNLHKDYDRTMRRQ